MAAANGGCTYFFVQNAKKNFGMNDVLSSSNKGNAQDAPRKLTPFKPTNLSQSAPLRPSITD
jgi:hypothetical protein